MVVKADAYDVDKAFFIPASECGVRSLLFDTGHRSRIKIDLLSALSFGFAQPSTGGERIISKADVRVYDYEDRTDVYDEYEPDFDNFLVQMIKVRS